MEYLTGEEYNIMRSSRGPRIHSVDRDQHFRKKFNYGRVFFYAALHAYKIKEFEQANKYWQQALLNGFRDEAFFHSRIDDWDHEARKFFKA